MPAAAVPWIAQAGGAIGASILGRRSAKGASQLSPAEQQAQQAQLAASQALTKSAGTLSAQGQQISNTALPQLQQAGRYFSTLAGGNRAATSQLLAPDIANANATYGGTQRSLSRFLKGPDRDYQLGEIARQRAGAIAGLYAGGRQRGVEGLANLSQYGLSTGAGLQTAGASALASAAGVAGNAGAQAGNARIAGADIERQAGADVGGLVFQILKGYQPKGKAPKTPSMPGGVSSGVPGQIGTTMPIPSTPGLPQVTPPRTTSDRPYGGIRF